MRIIFISTVFLALAAHMASAQSLAPLRIGDSFELHVSGVPAEEQNVFMGALTIDDQGVVNIPYLNGVKVAGLLPNQIQDLIQSRFKEEKIYTNPTVMIIVAQSRLVNVLGEVKAPQRIQFTPDMTLMTAINGCGGFSDFANQHSIRLIRDGKTTVYDAKQIRKDPTSDPKILPGDQIQIPQSLF